MDITDASSTAAHAGSLTRYGYPKSPLVASSCTSLHQRGSSTTRELIELAVSGHGELRALELPSFSISRVQSYIPDSVAARLSCGSSNSQLTAQEREKAMRALLNNLARAIEGGRNRTIGWEVTCCSASVLERDINLFDAWTDNGVGKWCNGTRKMG